MAAFMYISIFLVAIIAVQAKNFMMIIECDDHHNDINRCSINVPNLNESHREDPHSVERAMKERQFETELKEAALQYYNLRFKKANPHTIGTLSFETSTAAPLYDENNTTTIEVAEKPTMEFHDSCNFWKKISFKC